MQDRTGRIKLSPRDMKIALAFILGGGLASACGLIADSPEHDLDKDYLVKSDYGDHIFPKFNMVNESHRVDTVIRLRPFEEFEEVCKENGYSDPFRPDGKRVEYGFTGIRYGTDPALIFRDERLISGDIGTKIMINVYQGLGDLSQYWIPDNNSDPNSDGHMMQDVVRAQSAVVSACLLESTLLAGEVSKEKASKISDEYNQVKSNVLPVQLFSNVR